MFGVIAVSLEPSPRNIAQIGNDAVGNSRARSDRTSATFKLSILCMDCQFKMQNAKAGKVLPIKCDKIKEEPIE